MTMQGAYVIKCSCYWKLYDEVVVKCYDILFSNGSKCTLQKGRQAIVTDVNFFNVGG